MEKRIIATVAVVVLLVGVFLISNHSKTKEEKETTSFMNSTVLKVSNHYVTMQDENNIIYTFLVSDAVGLEVGESIQIEYKGELNTKEELQKNEVVSYKILEKVSGEVPTVWDDSGLFKDFYNMAYQKLNTMTLDEKIGQILLVRVPISNQIEDLKKYFFGGYLLFERDFTSKTKQQVIDMIKGFQNNAKIPLLIAVDEEGGTVSRISSNSNLVKTPFKSSRDLYQEGGFSAIKQDTINKSNILEELGINLNLAPVVDVSTDPSDYMYARSIGLDTALTSEYAKTVIDTSRLGHVSYTLKHFPGYGNNKDTHLGLSVDTRTLESIKTNDLPPFQAGIDAKAEAVLVSHNIVNAIDANMPASLSKDVHNLLRGEMKFTGIVITDDLSMKAISDNYQNTAVIDAILAGNDLLIVTDYEQAIGEIKKAITNSTLSEETINKLAFRILAWKYYKGLIIPNQK